MACKDCIYKHLGQAKINADEAELGYPLHRVYVVGHLAEVESELLDGHKPIAEIIREHRLMYMDGERIDFESLVELMEVL